MLWKDKKRCLIARILVTILILSVIPWLTLTASSSIITVPDDYATIQEAINAAHDGDIIFVKAGQYNETITIDKSLNLIGEDKETTIIDGNYAPNIILVKANYVNISGFTIQNTQKGDIKTIVVLSRGNPIGAIALIESVGCIIKNNTIQNANTCVHISKGSNGTVISDNKMITNWGSGVLVYDPSIPLGLPSFAISGTTISSNYMEVGGVFFPDGIEIVGASNCRITANNITGCPGCGILIRGKGAIFAWSLAAQEAPQSVPYPSDYNVVSNNSIMGGQYGFYAEKSNNNIVNNNNFSDIAGNLYLKECTNTTLRNNTVSNFGMEGSEFSHFMNDIDASNTVNGKPIYIMVHQSNLKINPSTYPDIGYLGIIDSKNITIWRLSIANKIQGLMLAQTTNCEISETSLSNNQVGIYLWNCSNNIIMGNTLIKSPIEMSLCGNNTIRGNTFQLSNLHLINSTDNKFHRNNFILSAVQIEGVQNNTWDDRNSWPNPFDCPICGQKRPVGNYWSDYQGEDNGLHTQSHNCPGDGIGDTELPVHGVDYYPLMKPWIPIMGDLDYDGRVSIKDLYKVAKNFDKTSP